MRKSAYKLEAFAANKRTEILTMLEEHPLDVLVIGGGITGAGIALDAASRGLRTGLVEMQDFAAGTSSRSTKLVHGGLRYLKQLEFKVVAEVGKEREIVYENGPHVTTPEWMLLPLYEGGSFGSFTTSIGLRMYDYLAGVKKSERRSMLSSAKTLEKEPLLQSKGLKGGGYYVEYRTDDARLTIEVMKKAMDLGALAVNYAKVESLTYNDQGKITGAVVQDMPGGKTYTIQAKKIVNAAGPWVDDIREMDKSKTGKSLRLTKGVHLVFDQSRFPLGQAVYFDTPDGRMVFAVPRTGKTYVGTTDTNYKGDITHPLADGEDRAYLIHATNQMFPSLKLVEQDIESSWAGLRPLIQQEGKDPSQISRKDEIFHSPSGLISMAGGKLTGYRKMAEQVVDDVVRQLKKEKDPAAQLMSGVSTRNIRISGGDVGGSARYESYAAKQAQKGIEAGMTPEESLEIAKFYGSNAEILFGLAQNGSVRNWGKRHGIPLHIAIRLWYAMDNEMTVKPEDFLIRRTGWLFFDIDKVRRWTKPIIAAMGEKLGWNEVQMAELSQKMEQYVTEAVHAN